MRVLAYAEERGGGFGEWPASLSRASVKRAIALGLIEATDSERPFGFTRHRLTDAGRAALAKAKP